MSELNDMALLKERHALHGFSDLRDIAYREAGLVLSEAKAPMIQSRLRHRLRALHMTNLKQYCDYVENEPSKSELDKLISALTTNVSGFFRESHHFDFLEQNVYPDLREKLSRRKTVRIWSAGCSTGQEPYSLVIHLLEKVGWHSEFQLKVLATDIDAEVLSLAQAGLYSDRQIAGLPPMLKEKYTTSFEKDSERIFQISDDVRSRIVFRRLNLNADWPMKNKFDLIFCRNVIIYFDRDTQDRLWPRFYDILSDEGVICIGHSERINSDLFVSSGPTAYKKA